jgi:hypothetical protein
MKEFDPLSSGSTAGAWTLGCLGRPATLLIAAALSWIVLGVARAALHAGDGLVGEYFTNADWSGLPAFSALDTEQTTASVMRRWNGSPPEHFSVRWVGFLTVGRPGPYTFATTSDDGSQLVLDNTAAPLVDNEGVHGPQTRSGTIHLDRGSHMLELRYAQRGGGTALSWSWSRGGAAHTAVPAWVLSQRRTAYSTAVAARILDWLRSALVLLGVLAVALSVRALIGTGPGMAGRQWLLARLRDASASAGYRNPARAIFSVAVLIVVLALPWPDGRGRPLLARVVTALGALNRTAAAALADFGAFQKNLDTPRAGEEVLPFWTQEVMVMLRSSGRSVDRYQLSDSIAAQDFVLQQVVASAWPRRLERGAKAIFILNTEPVQTGCEAIDRRTEVSLVHCP